MTAATDPSDTGPLEYFSLGRKIHRGLRDCSQSSADSLPEDVFYLWLHLGPDTDGEPLGREKYLNIIDESAAMGVNWLVITLGESASRTFVPDICRWAQETHDMVVCLHLPESMLWATESELLRQLPAESSYLLVDPTHAGRFTALEQDGVHVALAAPAVPDAHPPCNYPNKMIYVDAQGRLYTCGLVSGQPDFFLGTVLEGSLREILHNPRLPHSVALPDTGTSEHCSGCPPLVAKYLCHR